MELHSFIQTTLLEIARGIHDANSALGEEVPFTLIGGKEGSIDFEIQTVAEEQNTDKVGGKATLYFVKVLTIGGQAGLENAQISRSIHTLRFRVKPGERSFYPLPSVKNDEQS